MNAFVDTPAKERRRYSRVLLTRRGQSRFSVMDSQLESLAQSFGFHSVDLASASLEDQKGIAASADVIVGATGAAMANLAWARPGTRVGIWTTPTVNGAAWSHFGSLAHARGLDLLGLEIDPDCQRKVLTDFFSDWLSRLLD